MRAAILVLLAACSSSSAPETGPDAVARLTVALNGCDECLSNFLAEPGSNQPICTCWDISHGRTCEISVPADRTLHLGFEGPPCGVRCTISSSSGCGVGATGCALWGDAGTTVRMDLEPVGDAGCGTPDARQ
jgi:hypothetical protein